MESNNLKLALDFEKSAHKASKSGWFSKPEWDLVAQYSNKAATAFKVARHYEQALDNYARACDAYIKVNAVYMAAKCCESAGVLSEKQLGDATRAIELLTRASDLYLSHGSSPDKSAEVMERAAEICESVDTKRAAQLHMAVLSIYENEDRGRLGIPSFRKTTGYLVERKLYTEALEVQHRLIDICEQINNTAELNKCRLTILIILLASGDDIEATKQMTEFTQDDGFLRSHEFRVGDRFIQAYQAGDQDGFVECAQDQTLAFLESRVSQLARRIHVPGSGKKPNANVAKNSDSQFQQAPYTTTTHPISSMDHTGNAEIKGSNNNSNIQNIDSTGYGGDNHEGDDDDDLL